MPTLLRRVSVLALVLVSTGCAQVAYFFDERDPCQARPELGRPPGYQRPNWCGSGGDPRPLIVRDRDGRRLGTVSDR